MSTGDSPIRTFHVGATTTSGGPLGRAAISTSGPDDRPFQLGELGGIGHIPDSFGPYSRTGLMFIPPSRSVPGAVTASPIATTGSLQSHPSRAPSTRATGDNQEPEDRIRKSKLPAVDRNVISRACDLSLLEVINKVGWEDDLERVAKACYSQARVEELDKDPYSSTTLQTQWDPNLLPLFLDHKQTFRSKMAATAVDFAKKYNLIEIVNPDGVLLMNQQVARAVALCESILADKNWKIYFLHHHNTQQVELFSNPIFHDYHIAFWYKHSLSPIRRRRENDKMWETTPLRLLASSATALACGLRRVATNTNMRYALQEYCQMERTILNGMNVALNHTDPLIRDAFVKLLYDLHQRGLDSIPANPAAAVFYIPSSQQLQKPHFYPDSCEPQDDNQASGPVASGSQTQVVVPRDNHEAAGWTLGDTGPLWV